MESLNAGNIRTRALQHTAKRRALVLINSTRQCACPIDNSRDLMFGSRTRTCSATEISIMCCNVEGICCNGSHCDVGDPVFVELPKLVPRQPQSRSAAHPAETGECQQHAGEAVYWGIITGRTSSLLAWQATPDAKPLPDAETFRELRKVLRPTGSRRRGYACTL